MSKLNDDISTNEASVTSLTFWLTNRKLTYLFIPLLLFFITSLPNLTTPGRGFVFIVEELAGSILLLCGFFIFRSSVQSIILWLNRAKPWGEQSIARFLHDFLIILTLGIVTGALVTGGGWLFFRYYGEPEYFLVKQKILAELNECSTCGGPFYFSNQRFSILNYGSVITIGAIAMFTILFLLEESTIYSRILQQDRLTKEQVEKEQALYKLNALQHQLNPHFTFNTLNVLSGLMHEDLTKANEFIQKLSEINRYVMVQCEEVVSTVAKEIEFAKAYIFLLKIRFEDQLDVSFTIDESKAQWLLPSLTLEILVENAIKHNSLSTSAPLKIELSVENDMLIVRNEYRPRLDKSKSTGIGINNLQQRLIAVGEKKAVFEIKDGYYVANIPLVNPDK